MAARVPVSSLAPLALLATLLPQLSAPPVAAEPVATPLAWEALPAAPTEPPTPSALRWQPLPSGAAPSPPVMTPMTTTTATAPALNWSVLPDEEVITHQMAAESQPPDPPELAEEKPPAMPAVRNLARGITVNGDPFPDIALQVPNGFAADPDFIVSTTLKGVSRTRSCDTSGANDSLDCADLEGDIFLTPFRSASASLGFQWTVQSLSGRNEGTSQFSAQSLGFRAAVNLTPTTGLAFGGEHIVQLDSSTDLGRNFYLVLSQAIPLKGGPNPWLAVSTMGIGSDFFGYGGNGVLGSTNCLSGNNVSSRNYPDGTDCYWGPIGSFSLVFGRHLSIGAEFFGYGIGAGLSVRPLRDIPFTLSLYATDFLGNTPDYIEGLCTTDPCETRYLVRATMSF